LFYSKKISQELVLDLIGFYSHKIFTKEKKAFEREEGKKRKQLEKKKSKTSTKIH